MIADSERTENLWEQQRIEYINNLVEQIREEIGHRLCVERGDIAKGGDGWRNSIFIYKHGINKHQPTEKALYFSVGLTHESKFDNITNQYYQNYHGLIIKRYVTPNFEHKYEDEVEFFNSSWTKDALKRLLA